jgi:hypothetical protein
MAPPDNPVPSADGAGAAGIMQVARRAGASFDPVSDSNHWSVNGGQGSPCGSFRPLRFEFLICLQSWCRNERLHLLKLLWWHIQ